jgi:hypothetical protein
MISGDPGRVSTKTAQHLRMFGFLLVKWGCRKLSSPPPLFPDCSSVVGNPSIGTGRARDIPLASPIFGLRVSWERDRGGTRDQLQVRAESEQPAVAILDYKFA